MGVTLGGVTSHLLRVDPCSTLCDFAASCSTDSYTSDDNFDLVHWFNIVTGATRWRETVWQLIEDYYGINHDIACVAGGSGYPRELRSRTWVQKAAQVARRMGMSLVEFAASPQKVSRSHPLPPATQATMIFIVIFVTSSVLVFCLLRDICYQNVSYWHQSPSYIPSLVVCPWETFSGVACIFHGIVTNRKVMERQRLNIP